MKRFLALMVSVVLVVGLFAGCTKKNTGDGQQNSTTKKDTKVKIGLATDEGGKGDKSFNDSAIAGLDKIKAEYTVDPSILESKQPDQYEPNLKALASSSDLIFGVGFKMADAMTAVAKATPDKKFAIIDSEVKLPNVASVLFKEEEGSFLVGVIAGKTTKSNKIGFVGGMKMPLIQKFEAGFRAGVKAVNPNAEVIVKYAESFSDTAKGVEIAKSIYNSGADIIYHAAGGVGLGVFKAAKDAGKYAIGVDQDQAISAPDYKDIILVSMIKRVDVGTYDVSKSVIDNSFKGGTTTVLGLKEDGVGISKTINSAVSQDTIALTDKYKKAIIDGTIVVPTKPEEIASFKAPEVK